MTYVSEAHFFNGLIERDLESLKPNSRILEIGSGIGLLSLMLSADGFEVHSFEPATRGFGEMVTFREIILDCWQGPTSRVKWYDHALVPAEGRDNASADLVVAIHVLEHVQTWEGLIDMTIPYLTSTGGARFIQPNYAVPYEPHYEMPTFLSKGLTERLMRKRIECAAIEDTQEFWRDLSWITASQLRRYARDRNLGIRLSRGTSLAYIKRIKNDASFRGRKPRAVQEAAKLLGLGLRLVPTSLLPITDARLSPRVDINV